MTHRNFEPSHVSRYSRFVRLGKAICLICASLAVILIIIFVLFNKNDRRVTIGVPTSVDTQTDHKNLKEIFHPKYYGINENKEFYNIIAEKAFEDQNGVIMLDDIKAELQDKDQKMIQLSSNKGKWHQAIKSLELSGSVNMIYNNSYSIDTETAIIDIEHSLASSSEKVEVKGPAGTITASGFSYFQKENKIYFNGPVKTVLYSKK